MRKAKQGSSVMVAKSGMSGLSGADGAQTQDAVQHSWSMARHDPDAQAERPFDILFLHGMASGGWIWKPGFLQRFQSEGYRCWTLTLPGKREARTGAGRIDLDMGGVSVSLPNPGQVGLLASSGRDRSLHQMSDDLGDAISSIGRPVVVVAHSLGGAVAQLLMRRGRSPHGTVLACSVPPYGMWRASWEVAVTNPRLWASMAGFSVMGLTGSDTKVMRDNLFPAGLSERDFDSFARELRDESLSAMAQSMGFPPFAPLPGPRSDVLVVGASKDRLVPAMDVHATALYYGGMAQFVKGAGHALMLDGGAEPFAQVVLDWLERQ